MSDTFVRLRASKTGPKIHSVMGSTFSAGRWYRFSGAGDLVAYIATLRERDGDPDSRKLYDITDETGARKLEQEELQAAERALAAKNQPVTTSQVDRAGAPAGMTSSPAPIAPPSIPRPEAERLHDEAAREAVTNFGGTEASTPPTSKRQARAAAAASKPTG